MLLPVNFLPTTKKELKALGWHGVDIILVSGDTYIDSPFIGVAVIGRVLSAAGYRVGIIAQPDLGSERDICRLGEPELFWGVSGGSIDSMVANYTASRKRRKSDDFTPGGINNRRPDRAVIAYTNLIKKYYKSSRPIVLGGIEASLRRVAHYDFWANRVRKSILFDAKADFLLYGMAENSIIQLAANLKSGKDVNEIHGLCYPSRTIPENFIELPSYSEVAGDTSAFISMFDTFYRNNDPVSAHGLAQKQDNRYLVQNPPAPYLNQQQLDRVYELNFSRDVHPYYRSGGKVRAQDTIQFSLTTHRGCYGECNFCAIAVHQGRTVRSRSEKSIIKEARQITKHPDFKGNIMDVGGPTANMYGFECSRKLSRGSCADKRCLTPRICPKQKISHTAQLALLQKLRKLQGVKKVFIASGIRYDMILADPQGLKYLKALIDHHISGQMKVAPEHAEESVLKIMGKPGIEQLITFKGHFDRLNSKGGKKQFLTYYFIAAHPGCTMEHMKGLKSFCRSELKTTPEQTQIFTPTPSTYSTLMYWTGIDPFSGKRLFVEKVTAKKEKQKRIITEK